MKHFLLPLKGAVCLTFTGGKISDENSSTDSCDASEEEEQQVLFLFVEVNHGHLSSASGQIFN